MLDLNRVLTTELTGTTPASMRLTWAVDAAAHKTLETEIFGKRMLVTDQDHWTVPEGGRTAALTPAGPAPITTTS